MDTQEGKEKGVVVGSGGVNPLLPIGPKNPPRASQIQKGEVRNPEGWPKGKKRAKTVAREMLDFARKLVDDKDVMKSMLENGLLESGATNRELMIAVQISKAIKGDTPAANLVLRTAGEITDEVSVAAAPRVNLEGVSQEEIDAALKRMSADV